MIQKLAVLLLVFLGLFEVNGFSSGAPPDACVKDRFNQPHHGEHRSQSLETLPYQVTASSAFYQPGESITVTVSGGETFRGFFLQARDAKTQEWIGEFEHVDNTNVIPECSSITHADNRDKQQGTFVWKAPSYRQGQVFFTGTILKDYKTFWSNIVAQVAGQ